LRLQGSTRPFSDARWEREFLDSYGEAARVWAGYATIAAGLMYLAILAVVRLTEPHLPIVLWIRIVIATVLFATAWILLCKPATARAQYVRLAGTASVFGLGGVIVLFILPHSADVPQVVRASPSFIFGLFLHYAFLRLPLPVAAGIGWVTSLGALIWVPMVTGGSELLRTGLFLLFANIFGMIICHLIESRERELFSQRRQAEAARAEARERQDVAEEATRQKTRLIAAVSHDLRQPMTAAVAHLDVLHMRLDRGDLKGAADQAAKAQAAVAVLGSTLDHLLTAARYDSGTEALRVELTELGPLLKDVHDAFAPEAAARGIELRMRLPRDRVLLDTDRRSLHRVLSNLVSNAIKFTDPRPECKGGVLIAAGLKERVCTLDIIDTGIGIPPEDAEEIWKPYVQLNNVERDRERGLGLGLYLVQRIIEQLPGHAVTMRSRPARGSRFTLTVPGCRLQGRDEVASAQRETARTALSPLFGAYVLLVEDDLDARASLSLLLGEWGVLVDSAASMRQLFDGDAEAERLVDAIVCDYRLAAGANGIDAIASIRNRLGYAPHAVLITGEADIAPLRAMVGPHTTVLHKPFSSDVLAGLLLEAVRAVRQMEEG
jgi:signal transduction histidine kinase/CheY-like chemotaxis protein